MRKFCYSFKQCFLGMLFAFGCFTLFASETVTFTWEAGTEEKKFFIEVTSAGEKVTVNWGDGNVYTYTMQSMGTNWTYTYQIPGIYNVSLTNENGSFLSIGIEEQKLVTINILELSNLEWANFRDNKLEAIVMGNHSHLEQFGCVRNNLTTLDLSNCVNLVSLNCSNNSLSSLIIEDNLGSVGSLYINCKYNKLTSIDLSNIVSAYYIPQLICDFNSIEKIILPEKSLQSLYSINNKLPLSELYYLSQNVNFIKALGTQTLDTVPMHLNEWAAIDSVFHGSGTNYIVKINGTPAVEDEDYYYMEGNFMFTKEGVYRIETSNPLIISDSGSPAKVISFFNVTELSVSNNTTNAVFAYPNPTAGEVTIKGLEGAPANVSIYDMFGKNVYNTKSSNFNISHLPKGMYVIKINHNINKIIKK